MVSMGGLLSSSTPQSRRCRSSVSSVSSFLVIKEKHQELNFGAVLRRQTEAMKLLWIIAHKGRIRASERVIACGVGLLDVHVRLRLLYGRDEHISRAPPQVVVSNGVKVTSKKVGAAAAAPPGAASPR